MKNKKFIEVLSMDDKLILDKVVLADRFFYRLKGLMGKRKIEDGEGLLIKPCNSVHTFFMKFNLDIAFVDKNFKVLYIYRDLAPNKLSQIYKNSEFVIEAKAGSFSELKIGEEIKILIKA